MASTGFAEIWLEVSNIRLNGSTFEIQLRADREPEHPRWWSILNPGDPSAAFKTVAEALEKKRPVLAQVVAQNTSPPGVGSMLAVSTLTIQYAETAR